MLYKSILMYIRMNSTVTLKSKLLEMLKFVVKKFSKQVTGEVLTI